MKVDLVFEKKVIKVEGKDKTIKKFFLQLDNGSLIECKPVSYETKKGYNVSTWKDFDILASELNK